MVCTKPNSDAQACDLGVGGGEGFSPAVKVLSPTRLQMSLKGAEGGMQDEEEVARRGSSKLQRGGRWAVIAVMACKLRACVRGEAKMNVKAGPSEVRASEARQEG